MTESEWVTGVEPGGMLEFLRNQASDRKLRLFAVACCRRIWHLLVDERSREAVEKLEDHVEGLASSSALAVAAQAAHAAAELLPDSYAAAAVANAVSALVPGPDLDQEEADEEGPVDNLLAAKNAAFAAAWAMGDALSPDDSGEIWFAATKAEESEQCRLLRCIFANPFRPVPIDPAWLAWSDGIVVKLAQAIYEERAFDRMPVLADALEESGCQDQQILDHYRGPGPHARGCWVIDSMLRKK